jgi:Transglutaminase-like superfamily
MHAPRVDSSRRFDVSIPGGRTLRAADAERFAKLSAEAAADPRAPGPVRAERVVMWVHRRVRFGERRHTTFEGVLAEGSGNCADHAALVVALLRALGLRSRVVRELNAQPLSRERAAAAARAKSGLFGLEHNDHAWAEVAMGRGWIPADSSLAIFGTEAWVRRRLLEGVDRFGMVAPFLVTAYAGRRPYPRGTHYLVEELARVAPRIARGDAWTRWRRIVESLDRTASGVFVRRSPLDLARVHEVIPTIQALREGLSAFEG